MSEWQPIETAPKDGTVFLALNHDKEVWVSKYNETEQIAFRHGWRHEPERFELVDLADGTKGWVRREKPAPDKWLNSWTYWTRLYEFAPTHWTPLPAPPTE